MSLTYETVETTGENNAAMVSAAQSTELLQHFQQEVQVATGQAVERAMGYAEKVAQSLMSDMRKQLEGFAKPSERVMVVKVDEIKRKLSRPAHPELGNMLVSAKLGHNILMVGPAGCGKSTLAEQVAEALGLRYGFLSLTSGASEAWILGRWTAKGEFVQAQFFDFYRNGGTFCFEEIGACDPNITMLLNVALEQGYMYNPMTGEKVFRHKDFVCLACDNTFLKGGNAQYTARMRQDAAFIRRFDCAVYALDYLPEVEKQVCPDTGLRKKLQKARKFIAEKGALEIISTGTMKKAYELKTQGVAELEIMKRITCSWAKELADQSGLLKEDAPTEDAPSENEPF